MTAKEKEKAFNNNFVETPTPELIVWAYHLLTQLNIKFPHGGADRLKAIEIIKDLYRR